MFDPAVYILSILVSLAEVEEKKVGAYVPIHKRKGVVGAPISKGGGPMPNKPGGGGALTAARDNQLSEKEKKIKNLKKVSKRTVHYRLQCDVYDICIY
jgi:hypothetical protein